MIIQLNDAKHLALALQGITNIMVSKGIATKDEIINAIHDSANKDEPSNNEEATKSANRAIKLSIAE